MSKALEEQKIGPLEETKDGAANCKFPERYACLIEQRQKEGKLIRAVLIKKIAGMSLT